MSYPLVFKRFTVTIAEASVAQRASTTRIRSNQVEFYVTPGSTGPVFFGNSEVTADWIPRAAGSLTTFTSSSGGSLLSGPYFDLNQLYLLSATVGDQVIIQYLDQGDLA